MNNEQIIMYNSFCCYGIWKFMVALDDVVPFTGSVKGTSIEFFMKSPLFNFVISSHV
jgi:hypothetical protein